MVLAVGGQMVSSGSISIGQLSSFLLYTIYAGSSISGLSSFYSELMKGVGAASRIFELLDRQPTIKQTVGKPISEARGTIKFEHGKHGRNITDHQLLLRIPQDRWSKFSAIFPLKLRQVLMYL
jgi:ABC-type multidrug transport system fused ATPase/permease subunit